MTSTRLMAERECRNPGVDGTSWNVFKTKIFRILRIINAYLLPAKYRVLLEIYIVIIIDHQLQRGSLSQHTVSMPSIKLVRKEKVICKRLTRSMTLSY